MLSLPIMAALDRQRISDLTGTMSFVIWLFAQSPQLYENYRNGSVDGLSPVFLTQWMLGDVTNLIGSVLTGQLPFQIAVATYFCCVDACILVQFVYYWNKSRKARRRQAKFARRGVRSRAGSLTASTSTYPANPYSILSETSEILPPPRSRHNSTLRLQHQHHLRHQRSSSTQKRSLSRSQLLSSQHSYQHQSPSPQQQQYQPEHTGTLAHSRSRSRKPLSRSASADVPFDLSHDAQSSNYRALSHAALSVAQLAQEAARRRETLSSHQSTHYDVDSYFSFPTAAQRRSASRTSASNSRSRTRLQSNDPGLNTSASSSSASLSDPASSAARTAGSSGQAQRRRQARNRGQGDFVSTTLSPTREGARDTDESGHGTESESDPESEQDAHPSLATKTLGSTSSLDINGEEALEHSTDSLLQPRGRDMTRTASRIETQLHSQGASTPVAPPYEETRSGRNSAGTNTPTSSASSAHSSNRTARRESRSEAAITNDDVTAEKRAKRSSETHMSHSHHQLGREDHDDDDDDEADEADEDDEDNEDEDGMPAPLMSKSLAELPASGSRRALLERSLSSGSNLGAARASSGRRNGTKSPSTIRRSIGMVLLGIMMVVSAPGDGASAAAVPPGQQPSYPIAAGLLDAISGGGSAPPTWQRLVGRMAAWTCTVLYITSRIPQIWENYIRRSVQGLSILLFISAFLGNLLYTISILTNPEAVGEGRREYLQESIPFLLGSGGTLIFDLMIVIQWWMWSGKEPLEAYAVGVDVLDETTPLLQDQDGGTQARNQKAKAYQGSDSIRGVQHEHHLHHHRSTSLIRGEQLPRYKRSKSSRKPSSVDAPSADSAAATADRQQHPMMTQSLFLPPKSSLQSPLVDRDQHQ